MVILISKIPKNPNPKRRTNSKQLEIWDRIEKQKKKESKVLEIRRAQIDRKNQDARQKIGLALERIYTKISDLEKCIPRNFDPRNEYQNRRALSIKSEIKSLKLGLKILVENKDLIDNTSLLANDFSNALLLFSRKPVLNGPQKKIIDNINKISQYLKTKNIEYYQKAELLIKLTNNIVQLRKSLSGSIKTRKIMHEYDEIIQRVLENKVPF
ncbi:MAG TPA: hypothetical protein PK685_01985 [archaeon]|nr:hypothetical protein [archaeon]